MPEATDIIRVDWLDVEVRRRNGSATAEIQLGVYVEPPAETSALTFVSTLVGKNDRVLLTFAIDDDGEPVGGRDGQVPIHPHSLCYLARDLKVDLWSPESPAVYQLELRLLNAKGDCISKRFEPISFAEQTQHEPGVPASNDEPVELRIATPANPELLSAGEMERLRLRGINAIAISSEPQCSLLTAAAEAGLFVLHLTSWDDCLQQREPVPEMMSTGLGNYVPVMVVESNWSEAPRVGGCSGCGKPFEFCSRTPARRQRYDFWVLTRDELDAKTIDLN